VVPPLTEAPAPVVAIPAIAPASPLVPMTGRNGTLSAPQIRLHSKSVRAARPRITPSKMACWSLPHARSSCYVRPTAAVSKSSVWLRRPLACWEPVVTGARLPRLHASRVQRSRMVKGRSRLWKQGIRALVMDIGAPLSRSAFPGERMDSIIF